MSRPNEEHSVSFAEIESAMYTRRRLITKWIRLFATKAANIKIEKTDRQTDKLCTEITEAKTERKTATNAT